MAQITLDIDELPLRQEELVRCFAKPGDRIIVTRGGDPVFELTPAGRNGSRAVPLPKRKLEMFPGAITMAEDFNDPLPPEAWTDGPQ